MQNTSNDMLPGNSLVIPRRQVQIQGGDSGIYALETIHTHEAYSNHNPRSAFLVVNGCPSVINPLYTQQSIEELTLTRKAVAELLGVEPDELIPYSDLEYVLKATKEKRNYAIQSNQGRYYFTFDNDTLDKIKASTGFIEDAKIKLLDNNPGFRKTALHFHEHIADKGARISLSY